MNITYEDILAWVRDPQWVQALVAHDSPVINTGGLYTYVSPPPPRGTGRTRTLRGLTRVMAEDLLTPVDTGERGSGRGRGRGRGRGKGRGGARGSDGLRVQRLRAATAPDLSARPTAGIARRSSTMDGLRGAVRGSYIHAQIEAVVMLDATSFARKYRHGMNAWARHLMQDLLRRELHPFKAEFVVYDLLLRCATQIDLVAVDAAGVLVFIENKTGYANGKWTEASDALWRTPVLANRRDFPPTPRNRAVVQITLGALMAARMLRLPAAAWRAAVMRIDESVIEYLPVPAAFITTDGFALYQYLAQLARQ